MSDLVSDDDVYSSIEFQQYNLIFDSAIAYQIARQELIAARQRALAATSVAESPPFKAWYEEYLRSAEWRARADATKARSGGRCALCNSDKNVQAHHRTYERVGNEDPDDLTALCDGCHDDYHKRRRGF